MRLSEWALRAAGWKVEVKAPDFEKCLICVAPHTSNWDFILGLLAYDSVGRRAGFLMKESWFFFPLKYLFRALGGIPVARGRKDKKISLVDAIVEKFDTAKGRLQIAITPEGTRSRTSRWHTGFLQIALRARVPCVLGAIDAADKTVYVNDVFRPTGDIAADMEAIKKYYSKFTGIRPDKFSTDPQ